MLQLILERFIIGCFMALTLIGLRNGDLNYAGLNFGLVILYVFLYLQPLK